FEAFITIGNFGDVNLGALSTESNGMFIEGDELLIRDNNDNCSRAWVLKASVNESTGAYTQLRLIDIAGYPIESGFYDVRVIRSGRKNQSSIPVGAITSMEIDIMNLDSSDRLRLDKDIVQASAVSFTDEWHGYLDKAAYLEKQSDTVKLGVEEVYSLIQAMVEDGSPEDYYYNGDSLPPPANTLSNYNGDLKY